LIDLLAAKGSVEILRLLKSVDEPVSIPEINAYFQSQRSGANLTTATLYRRIKELELAGFLTKDESNRVSLSILGKEKLPDLAEDYYLKRSQRAILIIIQEEEGISVKGLTKYGFSPNTIQKAIEILQSKNLIIQYLDKPVFKPHLKPGRPQKLHKLTKKGLDFLKRQKELEKEFKK
jgi:DNA-binding HxlR family transcriptional regulator